MSKKKVLVKICDELEDCRENSSVYCNEIVCVKAKLNSYIGDDYNKLLLLKAQVNINSNWEETTISIFSLIISVMVFVTTIIYNVSSEYNIITYVGYCALCLFCIFVIAAAWSSNSHKNSARREWEKYIEIVLDEIERKNFN